MIVTVIARTPVICDFYITLLNIFESYVSDCVGDYSLEATFSTPLRCSSVELHDTRENNSRLTSDTSYVRREHTPDPIQQWQYDAIFRFSPTDNFDPDYFYLEALCNMTHSVYLSFTISFHWPCYLL